MKHQNCTIECHKYVIQNACERKKRIGKNKSIMKINIWVSYRPYIIFGRVHCSVMYEICGQSLRNRKMEELQWPSRSGGRTYLIYWSVIHYDNVLSHIFNAPVACSCRMKYSSFPSDDANKALVTETNPVIYICGGSWVSSELGWAYPFITSISREGPVK